VETEGGKETTMKNQIEKIVHFAGHDCVVQAERYVSNGHTALSLYNARTGEYVATGSVNMPDVPLAPNQVFIKDYSENAGMLKALEEAGIVRVSGVYVPGKTHFILPHYRRRP
jgi:hypothetical protein